MKNILIILSFLLLSNFGKSQTSSNKDVDIIIDFSKKEGAEMLKQISNTLTIKKLVIKNFNEPIQTKLEVLSKRFTYLEFENSSIDCINSFISSFSKFSAIITLKINYINQEDIKFRKIEAKVLNIEIDDCDEIVAKDFLKNIGKPDGVRSVSINYSSLNEIPTEIIRFNNIELLNLNDNLISVINENSLPTKSLDSVIIAGNVFDNPIDEYLKLKKLNLELLIIDVLTEDEASELKSKLPTTKIVQKEIAKPSSETENSAFGEITTSSEVNLIFSSAYLIYPRLFNSPLSRTQFDSTKFDQRFADSNYNGLFAISIRNQSSQSFQLYRYKKIINKRIAFSFYKQSRFFDYKYEKKKFTDLYTELTAFKDMVWILDDTISNRNFNSVLRKKNFSDIRIEYNPEKQNFTLILKSNGTFYYINAFPVDPNPAKDLEFSQNQYGAMYANYIIKLSKRAGNFNKQINRNCRALYAADRRYKNVIWQELRDQMSDKERQMTQQEWLKYYSKIAENEFEALQNSSPNLALLERTLLLKKYTVGNSGINDSNGRTVSYNFIITDKMNNNIPINSYILINKSQMNYRIIRNHICFNPIIVSLNSANEYVLIGLLSNGSISLTKLREQNQINSGRKSSDVIEGELATIRQILLNLEL